MQPIERYGVVALLFLVATFTAVLVMGEEPTLANEQVSAKKADRESSKASSRPAAPADADKGEQRLRMAAGVQSAPLKRDVFPEQRAAQEEAAALAKQQMMEERAARAERERKRLEEQLDGQDSSKLAALGSGVAGLGGFASAALGASAKQPEKGLNSSAQALREASSQLAQAAGLRSYKIKSGDTLGEIALKELGTSKVWKLITEVNPGLTPSKLIVNRTIWLPAQAAVEVALAGVAKGPESDRKNSDLKTPESVASSQTVAYTVLEGESLWRVAQRQLGEGKRFGEIVKLNPGINPNQLRVGQILLLPAESKLRSASAVEPSRSAAFAQVQSENRTGKVR